MHLRNDIPRPTALRCARLAAVLGSAIGRGVVHARAAGAIVGGTDQTNDDFARAALAYIEINEPSYLVVLGHADLADCRDDRGALRLRHEQARQPPAVARPSEITVRVGARNVSDPDLGVKAGVVAVLPQPAPTAGIGRRHSHDVALLALDRAMPHTPETSAEQRPGEGKSLLIAGYGATSDCTPHTRPSARRSR